MQIGNVALDNPYILAPMAGVTDLPFRLLCKEQGAGLVCMEMVSAKAITFRNKNTQELMETDEREKPVSLQLFGSDPDIMAQAAVMIEEQPFDILDINMGCPVPKVAGNGEGSALMKDPRRVGQIVSRVADAVKKPVTVKIRKGFDEEHVNAVEIARICEASGAAAVAVHGRTRDQYYSGKADWDIIRQVKEAVKIPVIGNGDVTSPQLARLMMEQTGCDGVMIARGARGNPWIFHRIKHYLQTGELLPRPGAEELTRTVIRHGQMLSEYKGEYTAIREMRKHIAWYTFGYPGSAKFRGEVNTLNTLQEMEDCMQRFLEWAGTVRTAAVRRVAAGAAVDSKRENE